MITSDQVATFKSTCLENQVISNLLSSTFYDEIAAPILDVGAGFADISASVFSDKEVVCLDIQSYNNRLPSLHRRVVGDFFSMDERDVGVIKSVLLIHVLQFLDEDMSRFISKLRQFNPESIVTVTNDNVGQMGDIVRWSMKNICGSNPETDIGAIPGYSVKKECRFAASLSCGSFDELTHQVLYLLDASNAKISERRSLFNYLASLLEAPVLVIDQTIKLYTKSNERHHKI